MSAFVPDAGFVFDAKLIAGALVAASLAIGRDRFYVKDSLKIAVRGRFS